MKRSALSKVVVAVALAAGSLLLPTSANASGAPTSAGAMMVKPVIPSAPCRPDGVARSDNVIADVLRPSMNGQRLGRSLSGYNISCARTIVANVQARGLNQRAAVIAVTAAITESTLHNYIVAVDHDSLGLFQQRPAKGWGRPEQLVDPRYATQAFLNAMIRKNPAGAWLAGDVGQICQTIQGSAYPAAYAPEAHDAQLVVAMLWPRTAAPAVASAKEKTAPASPTKPAVPLQRTLVRAASGQGATDGRYDLSTADWNGDRYPDLVVVQRSDTATGRTELYILNGAPGAFSFQPLLLHTGTALGPTDDRHAFSMADWNGDGRQDLVVVQKSGTPSGRTELRVVDGASSFQRYLVETATALGPTDDRHAFSVADWNGDGRQDLVVVQKSGTASRRTEARILDGASSFRRTLLKTVTALGPTDDRHAFSVADWNGDGRQDLVAVQKSGTASGRTEVLVLAG